MSNIFSGLASGINAGIGLGEAATAGIRRKRQLEEQRMLEEERAARELSQRKELMRLESAQRKELAAEKQKENDVISQKLYRGLNANNPMTKVLAPELYGTNAPSPMAANGMGRLGKSSALENPRLGLEANISGLVNTGTYDNMLQSGNSMIQDDKKRAAELQKTQLDREQKKLAALVQNRASSELLQSGRLSPETLQLAENSGIDVSKSLNNVFGYDRRMELQRNSISAANNRAAASRAAAAARQQRGFDNKKSTNDPFLSAINNIQPFQFK